MKRRLFFPILCVAVLGASSGWADGAPPQLPYGFTQASVNPSRTVVVGLTLGSGWNGFWPVLMPNYEPQYFYQTLDIELELYVNWMLDTSDPMYSSGALLPIPVPLRLFAWFVGHHSDFEVHVIQETNPPAEYQYKTCAIGDGLEAPLEGSFPLTADARLHVADIFGGFGSWTLLQFTDCRPTGDDPECGELYEGYLAWVPPGTHWTLYPDRPGEFHDYPLGTMYPWWDYVDHGANRYPIFFEAPVVHWPSSDIGAPVAGPIGPSAQVVDEDDLAYLSTYLGKPRRWGFATENPPFSPTFQCNLAPWGPSADYIDHADLSVLASNMDQQCLLSKPGAGSEVAAILEWFGIAATGRMVAVGPNGETIPEYDVVDWEKNSRAVADPHGYVRNLNSAPAKEAPWGLVKQLYR